MELMVDNEKNVNAIWAFEHLRTSYYGNPFPSVSNRIEGLKRLRKSLLAHREQIQNALFQDFRKPPFESDASELLVCLMEIQSMIKHLNRWSEKQAVSSNITLIGTRSYTILEPKGVVLIFSPWNFPINLSFVPLISAFAAGNKIILKPSELTSHTSKLIEKIVKQAFTDDEIIVLNGGVELAEDLIKLPFDHIFFTGSGKNGKRVMQMAAQNLTPVTLELGGKSPVVIDQKVNLKQVVERVAHAKIINAGQVCISPDYIIIHKDLVDEFIILWKQQLFNWFGDHMVAHQDYCGIIDSKHYHQLLDLVNQSLDEGAELVEPIELDSRTLKIKPILLRNVNWNAPVMQVELFGPVLPIITYSNIEELLPKMMILDRPLCLYVFSKRESFIKQVMNVCRSGGVSINNCLINFCNLDLPFGGNHQSGMGYSHGKYGLETFSHVRSVSKQVFFFSSLKLFYPNYSKLKQKIKNLTINLFS